MRFPLILDMPWSFSTNQGVPELLFTLLAVAGTAFSGFSAFISGQLLPKLSPPPSTCPDVGFLCLAAGV